jgi:hypothetical protein
MQRYYVQYLTGYDAISLNQMIQNLQVCPEDESIILSSICSTIQSLSVKQGNNVIPVILSYVRSQTFGEVVDMVKNNASCRLWNICIKIAYS